MGSRSPMIGGSEIPTAPWSLAHSSDLRDSSMLIKGGTAHQRKRPSPSRHISATHRFQLLHSANSTQVRSVSTTCESESMTMYFVSETRPLSVALAVIINASFSHSTGWPTILKLR